MAKTKISRQKLPLAVKAYRIIHERIITLDFEPGQYLDEKRLISELGIGRTPIREALVRLASESLVKKQPNKGFIVTPLTIQNIKALFEALHIMEMGVVSLVVHQDSTKHLPLMQKAQQEFKMALDANNLLNLVWSNHNFHMYFAHCSANEYLVRSLRDVRNELNRLAYLSFSSKIGMNQDLDKHFQSVCREHEQIMEYLKIKELNRLKKTIEKHIQAFQRRIIIYMTTSGA